MPKPKLTTEEEALVAAEDEILASDDTVEIEASDDEAGSVEIVPEGEARTPSPPPVPAAPERQMVPSGRFDEVVAQKNQLQERLAHIEGMIAEARRQQQEAAAKAQQPEKKVILDRNHPDFNVAEAFDHLIERQQHLDTTLQTRAQQEAAWYEHQQQQYQQQAAVQQAVQIIDSGFDQYAAQNPGFTEAMKGYVQDETRRRAAATGIPIAQAEHSVRSEMYEVAAGMMQRGQNPFVHWHRAFAGFAPAPGAPTPAAAGRSTSPPAAPPGNRMTSLSEAPSASGSKGRGKGFVGSLAEAAELSMDELKKLDLDALDRAILAEAQRGVH